MVPQFPELIIGNRDLAFVSLIPEQKNSLAPLVSTWHDDIAKNEEILRNAKNPSNFVLSTYSPNLSDVISLIRSFSYIPTKGLVGLDLR